jgi:hypothetical protein
MKGTGIYILIAALMICGAIIWSGNADRESDCLNARRSAPIQYAPDGRRYAPISCE